MDAMVLAATAIAHAKASAEMLMSAETDADLFVPYSSRGEADLDPTHSLKPAQEAMKAETRVLAPVCVVENMRGNLAKVFTRDADGHVQKSAAAALTLGKFAVQEICSLDELDQLLDRLRSNQAALYGCPPTTSGLLASKAIAGQYGAISRTREYFQFREGGGVLMLDSDSAPGQKPLVQGDLVTALKQACPYLQDVAMLWRPSSSSGIEGAGILGQRIYILIDNAKEIPRVGKNIFDRLWLANYGYYNISKAGTLLVRAPIDAAVFQPERLDFAARPILQDGIQQTKYDSIIYSGSHLAADSVTELTHEEQERLAEVQREARAKLEPEVAEVRKRVIEERITDMAASRGMSEPSENIRVAAEQAIEKHLLMGEWELINSKGETVTVGEVLDNPIKWHNARFADPLEPDDDHRVAFANLRSGGRPFLYSHKHGGVYFTLERAPRILKIEPGELPEQVDALVEIFQKDGDLFERAGTVVYVDPLQRIVTAKQAWLAVRAQRSVRFERLNKNNQWVPTSCPAPVVNGVLSLASRYRLPALSAVRNTATMDSSGRVIDAPGFDETTGILILCADPSAWPSIPRTPTRAQLVAAFATLWKPFSKFPYASAADASVVLAAVLTTSVRATLPTAPAFGFSATAAGTGKTLLAQSIGFLYSGVVPAVNAPITQEEEWRKALFAAALSGTTTYLLDNAERSVASASLAAAITAGAISDRVLGESRNETVDHRMMIMATGNGLRLIGDLNRRFLVSRLDAQMEACRIVTRKFDLNPLEYCKNHRVEMNAAALTLIRAYAAAGFPGGCDGLASFDQWNKLVRSTIMWLINEGIVEGFVDPIEALQRDTAHDPDAELLVALMQNVVMMWGLNQRFTVRELILKACNSNELSFVLNEIAGDKGGVNAWRLGNWVSARENRIVHGMALVRDGKDRTGTVQWKVKKM